ncbi:hypothetical protein IT397_03465 [Candidatus Nomurabacteria bacterium]|nr:hypothetical protein [Candidatus Nomurabacteria bacterium]
MKIVITEKNGVRSLRIVSDSIMSTQAFQKLLELDKIKDEKAVHLLDFSEALVKDRVHLDNLRVIDTQMAAIPGLEYTVEEILRIIFEMGESSGRRV